MQFSIDYGPAYAMATCNLESGDQVIAEAGAMVSMTPGIDVQTSSGAAGGGILGGLKRAALGGESFFMNTFTASATSQVSFAPASPGDIVHHQLDGQTNVMVTSGSYLFSDGAVTVDTKWGGARTFFSKEGLFLLNVAGAGNLFLSSYGAIRKVDLVAGQTFIVDTGHVVAFHAGMGYNVRKFGGWKSTLLGGEGLVVELTGPGSVWIQTRSPESFAGFIAPFLPIKSSGNGPSFSFGS
ncbi:MAG: TIGR00266 family protein [Acidimicrobiia bacterium]